MVPGFKQHERTNLMVPWGVADGGNQNQDKTISNRKGHY
jgi:hypothetical protein